jgi:hypothetical protein
MNDMYLGSLHHSFGGRSLFAGGALNCFWLMQDASSAGQPNICPTDGVECKFSSLGQHIGTRAWYFGVFRYVLVWSRKSQHKQAPQEPQNAQSALKYSTVRA